MSDDLLIVPVPSIVAVLLNHEKAKGAPLTEQEVLEIRDRAECIAMPRHAFDAVREKRGYDDLDMANLWKEWCMFRDENPELLGS